VSAQSTRTGGLTAAITARFADKDGLFAMRAAARVIPIVSTTLVLGGTN
jgi:hypothetical protein